VVEIVQRIRAGKNAVRHLRQQAFALMQVSAPFCPAGIFSAIARCRSARSASAVDHRTCCAPDDDEGRSRRSKAMRSSLATRHRACLIAELQSAQQVIRRGIVQWTARMKIAQIAPLVESVPPRLYGGTERIASYLTEALVADGHEVTLFASGQSITTAKLVPCCAQALRLNPSVIDPIPYYMLMLDKVRRMASQFDVMHFHID
jgi:Glycosyltransferase Family 4